MKLEKWWRRSCHWVKKINEIRHSDLIEKLILFFSSDLTKKQQDSFKREFNKSFLNMFDDPEYTSRKQKKGVTITDIDFLILHHHIELFFTKSSNDYKDFENILEQYGLYKHYIKPIILSFEEVVHEEENDEQYYEEKERVDDKCVIELKNNIENDREFEAENDRENQLESKVIPLRRYTEIETFCVDDDDSKVTEGKIHINKKGKEKKEKVVLVMNMKTTKEKKNKKKKNNKNNKAKTLQELPSFNEENFPTMLNETSSFPTVVDSERYRRELKIYRTPQLEKQEEFPIHKK